MNSDEATDSSAVPPLPTTAEALQEQDVFAAEDTRYPKPGSTWVQTYLVRQPLEAAGDSPAWFAVHLGTKREVVIVNVRSADDRHDEAWERLRMCASPVLLKPTEARLIDDGRFEIFDAPAGLSLHDWKQDKGALPAALLAAWVKDLADALENLQRNGLMHPRLDPTTLYVDESTDPPHLTVGGLDAVVSFARNDAVALQFDPFYGPPEGVGRELQPGGEGLIAWHWWSVGRVIQELVLGRHIIEHMLDFKMSRASIDDRDFAEKLLLEKAHGDTRAGACESMPAMDKRIDLLLHGLLTSSADARWGLEDVRRWLQGETPRQRYAVGTEERLFRWRGRGWTVPEAADAMRSAELWEEGRRHVFTESEADTLVSFLRSESSMKAYAQKLDEALALARSPEVSKLPPVPLREAILMMALQRLAGGSMTYQGRKLDNAMLRDMASADGYKGTNMPLIQVLANPGVIVAMEKFDFETGRMLGDATKLAGRALDRAYRQRWLTRNNMAETMRMWALAFEVASVSQSERQKLKELYARSDDAEIQAMFQLEQNTPDEVLLLAWMLPVAQQRYQFVTHEEWTRRQLESLMARGRALSGALFWKRLHGRMRLCPLAFGNLVWLIAGWALAGAAIAFAWPGLGALPAALLPLAGGLSLRALLPLVVQPLVGIHAPTRKPWRFTDGDKRCITELGHEPERNHSVHELAVALAEVNADLARIRATNASVKALPKQPRLLEIWVFGLVAWASFIGLVFISANKVSHTPDPLGRFARAWHPDAIDDADMEHFPPPQKLKEDFPFVIPKRIPQVMPIKEVEASEAVTQAALRRGAYYCQDYRPEDIGAPVLVRVPTDEYYGFMMYDPVKREMLSKSVLYLKSIPARRVFISVQGRTVWVPNY